MFKCLPVLAFLALICLAPASFAQHKIELYADLARTQCELFEDPGIVTIHAWLTGPTPVRAVQFAVPTPACWGGATWVGDEIPPTSLAIGDSQTDWSVAFFTGNEECIAEFTPPVYIGGITYMLCCRGSASPCCQVEAGPTPNGFKYTDCNHAEHPLTVGGQTVVINLNESCQCLQPVATEASTWGRVKSLYR